MSTNEQLLRAIQEAFKARDNQQIMVQQRLEKEINELRRRVSFLESQVTTPVTEILNKEQTPTPTESLLSKIQNREKIWSGK